ncbi:MAG TPA: hydroxymethylbilane synthase [Candidatus Brocadiales bacterium]|nr:hydroxymethylbilane synthase [Candidatus Brocadiales bacterium]
MRDELARYNNIMGLRQEITIGSRGSKLALTQTNWVKAQLERLNPHRKFSVEIIHTRGDKITDVALFRIGGKGLFTKELEVALLEGKIDLAVHSLKDLPTELPPNLALGAIPEREDPHDLLIGEGLRGLRQLPAGARVGTSSLRRRAQIMAMRPDIEVVDLRGNLDTRLKKLKTLGLNAIIVARAGVNRLGVSQDSAHAIPYEEMLPAVGQGALAIEIRRGDKAIEAVVSPMDHVPTHQAVEAERALMLELQGGCQVPIGAIAHVKESTMKLEAVICSLDGKRIIRDSGSGPVTRAREIGIGLAQRLLKSGGREILEEIRQMTPTENPA